MDYHNIMGVATGFRNMDDVVYAYAVMQAMDDKLSPSRYYNIQMWYSNLVYYMQEQALQNRFPIIHFECKFNLASSIRKDRIYGMIDQGIEALHMFENNPTTTSGINLREYIKDAIKNDIIRVVTRPVKLEFVIKTFDKL